MQQEKFLEKAKEDYKLLASKITTLQNFVDGITGKYKELQSQYAEAIRIIKEKDKQLQKLELIEHQHEQLKKMVYGRTSEKSVAVLPDQLRLDLNTGVVEACSINDGQRVASYTKQKAKNENHPGRNRIPEHLRREYIDIYPKDRPADAELFDTEETEQLEYDPGRLFATVYRRFKYKAQDLMVQRSSSLVIFLSKKINVLQLHHSGHIVQWRNTCTTCLCIVSCKSSHRKVL